jgi:hypothetical protein
MRGQEHNFTPAEIEQFDADNRRLKDEVAAGTDTADRERRDRQDGLLREIRARAGTAECAA